MCIQCEDLRKSTRALVNEHSRTLSIISEFLNKKEIIPTANKIQLWNFFSVSVRICGIAEGAQEPLVGCTDDSAIPNIASKSVALDTYAVA